MAQRNPSRPLPQVKNQLRPVSDWVGHISDQVTCPYESSHVMKHHKLMRHLPKCEKRVLPLEPVSDLKLGNNGEKSGELEVEVKMETCPYNSLHRYPSGKQGDHFRECKTRAEDFMARYLAGESLEDADQRYDFKDVVESNSGGEVIIEAKP